MKNSQDPDFGATGQFELTGVYFVDKKTDATFATTLGMESIKSLILLGAGHAHVQVLTQLAKNRRADLDVTLVTPWAYQTYSGMTPGYVAGHYAQADCQINLEPLLREAGVRWISARCSRLDANTSSIMLDYGPSTASSPSSTSPVAHSPQRISPLVSRPAMLTYNLLSIDTGSVMERRVLDARMPGASEHGLPIRPIEQFVNRWTQALQQAKAKAATHPGHVFQVCVVGAGATGVELACAMHQGLRQHQIAARITLISATPTVAANYPVGVQKKALAHLKRKQIEVVFAQCSQVHSDHLELDNGNSLPSDLTVLASGAHAPTWLAHSGLALDQHGHVLTNKHLQSTSHPNVFAAGDVATRVDQAHPRNGVFAVRAGPNLGLNLLASASDQPLNAHTPRPQSLNILSCGTDHAIANWGRFSAEGGWAWRWKDRIDREFMASFQRSG
jgi:NADH dehydrogenase FAD-containing subunit